MPAPRNEMCCGATEPSAKHPVERARRSTPLHMPKDRGTSVRTARFSDVLGNLVPNPTEPARHGMRRRGPVQIERIAPIRDRTLGDDNNRRLPACPGTLDQCLDNRFSPIRNLGQKDDVSTPGDPGVKRDPPCIPPHDLNHHHPVMTVSRRMKAVNRFRGNL